MFIPYITYRYSILLMLCFSIVGLTFSALIISSANAQGFTGSQNRQASIYSIYNVEVDETSRNVTNARTRALRNGQREALEILFRRIILSEDRSKLPNFSNEEVTEFISGFEINNERRSTVRYLASLVVHFNRDKVNQVLSQYQIPYAETMGTAVSVLPVLEDTGALLLWEKGNGWRNAWENFDVINNLVPINTPESSLQNRMYISALQAKYDDNRSIKNYINHNALNDLIIATATVEKDLMNEKLVLNIALKRNNALDDNNPGEAKQISVSVPAYTEYGDLNLDELYSAGVKASTAWVDDLWKSRVLVSFGSGSKILAIGKLSNVNDWFIIQKQLGKVSLVRDYQLKGLTVNQVDLEIEFAGDAEQLALSLAQQGLLLEQDEISGEWSIGVTDIATKRSFIQ